MRAAGRLPPGQSLTLKWPLHAGSVPRFDPRTWDFRVFGLVEELLRLSWEEFSNLSQSEVFADMHCVTRWSRFDNQWGGLLAAELIKRVKLRPEARHMMVHAEQGYTANLPLSDFLRPTTIFALRHVDGGASLPWQSTVPCVGSEFALADETGRPLTAFARRIITNGRKIHRGAPARLPRRPKTYGNDSRRTSC
jgi:hypothetical protein